MEVFNLMALEEFMASIGECMMLTYSEGVLKTVEGSLLDEVKETSMTCTTGMVMFVCLKIDEKYVSFAVEGEVCMCDGVFDIHCNLSVSFSVDERFT